MYSCAKARLRNSSGKGNIMAREKDPVDEFLQMSLVAERRQRLEAERRRVFTLARQLSAQAITSVRRELDSELSLLLAVEAAKLYQGQESRLDLQADEALRRALGAAPRRIIRYEADRESDPASVDLSPLPSIEFSPSGRYLLAANFCGAVHVVDVETGGEVVALHVPAAATCSGKFSSDERMLAIEELGGTIHVLRIPRGDILTEVQTRMAAFSSEGAHAGMITSTGEVLLLKMAEPYDRAIILPHEVEARFIAVDLPGERLVTIDEQGTLHLWDVANSKESFVHHDDTDFSFATFSPDGGMLAAVGKDKFAGSGCFYLWDTRASRQIASQRYQGEVERAVFSPSGQWVAVTEAIGFVHLWDAHGATALRTYDGELYCGCAESRDVEVFSPNGRRIIIHRDKGIAMLDTATGEEVAAFRPEHSLQVVTFIKFVRDGSRLAMVSNDDVMRPGILHLWNTDNGNKISTVPHSGWIIDFEVSPDGGQIATISSSDPESIKPGPAYLWSTSTGEPMSVIRHTHIGSVSDVEFSRDGTKLATIGADSTIRVWDRIKSRDQLGMYFEVPTANELAELERSQIHVKLDAKNVYLQQGEGDPIALSHETLVEDFYLSQDCVRIATVIKNRNVHVWDTTDGDLIAAFPATSTMGGENADADVDGIRFSSDGKRLAISVSGFCASVWDIEDNSEVAFFLQDEAALIDTRINPNGTRLAVLAGTGFVRRQTRTTTLWDVECLEKIAWVNGATLAAFSPDGTLFATGGMDGKVHVLDAQDGEEVMILSHEEEIKALQFSPDGTLLATGSKDRTARVWDTSAGIETAILKHYADVSSVAFNSDGTELFTHDSEGNAYKWSVDTDALVALACTRLTRNLTQQEWRTYVGAEEPYRETCPDLPKLLMTKSP